MKIIAALALVAGVLAFSGTASADPPACNWGVLTSEAIAAGFDQGPHASSFDTPRQGLPNLFGQGDLEATCVALS